MIDLLRLTAALLLLMVSSGVSAQDTSSTYWGLLTADGSMWCGYADHAEFTAKARKEAPHDSTRVKYSARNELLEITDQLDPESGDWRIIDTYTPSGEGVHLVRTNLLGVTVIEETTIRAGQAAPFRITSLTTLDGQKTNADPSKIVLPDVPARAGLDQIPFMALAAEMHRNSIKRLCKKVAAPVAAPPRVPVAANIKEETYLLMLKSDGRTWCGYAKLADYAAALEGLSLLGRTTARVDYLSGKLWVASYHSSSVNDHWQVKDDYRPAGRSWTLRRAFLLRQRGSGRLLNTIQDTTIHGRRAEPFHVVSISRIDGMQGDPTKAVDPATVNFPPVPVSTDPSREPFVQIASELHSKSVDTLCKSAE
jgi:hypothetical protein